MKTTKRAAPESKKSSKKRNQPQRSTLTSLRLTPDELQTCRYCAKAAGASLSEWIRAIILVDAEEGRRKTDVRPRTDSDPLLLCRLAQISRNVDELVSAIRRHRPFEAERLILEIRSIGESLLMIAGVK